MNGILPNGRTRPLKQERERGTTTANDVAGPATPFKWKKQGIFAPMQIIFHKTDTQECHDRNAEQIQWDTSGKQLSAALNPELCWRYKNVQFA